MIVHRRVLLAFVGTELAREHARVQLRVDEFMRRFGLARHQPQRRLAHVRTIEIRADAAPQMRHLLFTETRVRTRDAHLATQGKRLEHIGIFIGALKIGARVAAEHGFENFLFHGIGGLRAGFIPAPINLTIPAARAMGTVPRSPVGDSFRTGEKLHRIHPDDDPSSACYRPSTLFPAMVASSFKTPTLRAVASPDRPLRLSPAQMYARVLAGDPAWNGRFFTGVLTTGIYCLPSCKARKPKRENVRFFPTCEAARAAGLRPCKKCHPDDFARGADPVLESVETLVAEIRADPAAFPDTRAIVRRLGFGATRTVELFRLHYHTTPSDLLLRARLAAAQSRLLSSSATLADIAFGAGFDALSVFHENFRALNGLTPAAYRSLPGASQFDIILPSDFSLGYLRRALSRDTQSVSERLEGDLYTAAVSLSDGSALLTLQLDPRTIRVRLSRRSALEAHAIVAGLLGLDQPTAAFARLAKKLGLARLVAGRPGFRISRIASLFDGLLWSIIGQQINFAFACLLKRRLTELAGETLPGGLRAPPTPAAVARIDPVNLLPLQFSRQKADYVVATARAIVDGRLDLAALTQMSATRVERTLLALRGFGPWSVNYVMMRALGFADCVPLGDTGVTSGLQSLLALDERPDIDATRRLMAVFSPYRSLATAHLWQLPQPVPT